jgi:hypothetical protein
VSISPETVGRLGWYQQRRLELADLMRAALHVARGRRDEMSESRVRQLLARLADDTFTLAVVGQFSRGKSTLMNAVLGGPYLPTGALPMTSVVTTVRYGSRARAWFRRRGGLLPIEVPVIEAPRMVAQSSAQRAELQVVSVDIELPVVVLRLGIRFVDTPGVGSAIGVNTATTRQFLPEADAVLFLTGFDSALTEAEVDFLAEVGRHGAEVFVIVNKRDLVSASAAAEVLEFARRTLPRVAPDRVFGVSALEALAAKPDGDDERLAASGLPDLEAALTEFLTTEKAGVFLRNLAGRTMATVARQSRDLRLATGRRPANLDEAFDAELGDVRDRLGVTASALERRIEAELPNRLEERSGAWQDDLRRSLAPLVARAAAVSVRPDSGKTLRGELGALLDRGGAGVVRDWSTRRAAEVNELLVQLATEEIGALLALGDAPELAGLRLMDALLVEDAPDRGWSLPDVPSMGIPAVAWTVPLDPSHRLRAATREGELRRRLPAAVDAAIAAADAAARDGFVRLAGMWVRDLSADVERRIDDSAARFRGNVSAVASPDDVATLEALSDHLSEFSAGLTAAEPTEAGYSVGQTVVVLNHPDDAGCPICGAMETVLADYLQREQLQLATREVEQNRLAGVGGFCALHTWQYSTLASPLGISAGYAKLAEATAAALEADGDGRLRTVDCPLCAALAESEADAVADIAAADTVPLLCLRHLGRVLDAGIAPERGHAIAQAAAAALRRASQDMRVYALKREALHSALITEEESDAYLAALRLLAGQPSLVQTWVDES